MKNSALTIRLDRALERQLAALAKRSGRSRSEIARDALRRQLAILQFEDAHRTVMPFAEARGYLTDEDVFRVVSCESVSIRTSWSLRLPRVASAPMSSDPFSPSMIA
jgi:predicted transcriptional regulator